MQSEDFDKRIRDAAENHHPQYNEKAWNGMEKLLDKHMPVEKDRRRFIFFLLLATLLLGGGAWLLTTQPWKRNSDAVAAEKTIAENNNNTNSTTTIPGGRGTGTGDADRNGKPLNDQTGNGTTTDGTTSSTGVQPNGEVTTSVIDPKQGDVSDPVHTNTKGNSGNIKGDEIAVSQSGGATGTRGRRNTTTSKDNKNVNDKGDQPSGNEVPVKKPANDPVKTDLSVKANDPSTTPVTNIQPPVDVTKRDDKTIDNKTDKKTETVKKDAPADNDPDKTDKKTTKTEKPNKRPANSLSLTISAGGDVSSVKFKNPGKLQSVFGAGLNYSFHDKFIIRSGIYTGHKTYTAKLKDYKVDPTVNTSYLERIEADCNILEIPVGVAYNFGKAGGRSNVYAATSLSTFIMKEEKYDYVYVLGNGTTYSYDWDYKNQNKHFFSVLTVSAGYTRNFGKRFSLSAEPYVKFPLSGVGQGKVKLNNTGVLFTFGTKLTR
jgi:hypothetical protein